MGDLLAGVIVLAPPREGCSCNISPTKKGVKNTPKNLNSEANKKNHQTLLGEAIPTS